MKILFLSGWFPFPPNNGSKIRILNLLRILAINHQITLLSFLDEPEKPPQIEGISSVCNKIITLPFKKYEPNSIKSIIGFLSLKPRSMSDTFSPKMAHQIKATLEGQDFNLVIASQIEMASYYQYFNHKAAIFDEIEIGVPLERYTKAKSAKSHLRQGITWFKHKHYLTKLLKSFPVCTVASQEERDLLIQNRIRKENVFVIPNFIDLTEYQNFTGVQKNKTIIFTGSFRYQPNYTAMVWFLENVFPNILGIEPDIQLLITGNHMNLPLPLVANVIRTGYVDDIRLLISKAAVSIVPLLSGGGTRLKILEAMALHTPVVSTSKGAQGIKVIHGKNILLADNPQDFSNEVIRILQGPKLGQRIADQAFDLVKKNYNSDIIREKYENLLQKASPLS